MVAANIGSFSVGEQVSARAVAARQLERDRQVPAEGAGAVVVLAMHVVGDGAADRDEARAGRDGQEPAAAIRLRPAGDREDVGEPDAGLAGQHARVPVEGDEAVEAAAVEQPAARVERHVAIGPAAALGEGGRCAPPSASAAASAGRRRSPGRRTETRCRAGHGPAPGAGSPRATPSRSRPGREQDQAQAGRRAPARRGPSGRRRPGPRPCARARSGATCAGSRSGSPASSPRAGRGCRRCSRG